MTWELLASFLCGGAAAALGGALTATVVLWRQKVRLARPAAPTTDLTAYTVPED